MLGSVQTWNKKMIPDQKHLLSNSMTRDNRQKQMDGWVPGDNIGQHAKQKHPSHYQSIEGTLPKENFRERFKAKIMPELWGFEGGGGGVEGESVCKNGRQNGKKQKTSV